MLAQIKANKFCRLARKAQRGRTTADSGIARPIAESFWQLSRTRRLLPVSVVIRRALPPEAIVCDRARLGSIASAVNTRSNFSRQRRCDRMAPSMSISPDQARRGEVGRLSIASARPICRASMLAVACLVAACSVVIDGDKSQLGAVPIPCVRDQVAKCPCPDGTQSTQLCNQYARYDRCACDGHGAMLRAGHGASTPGAAGTASGGRSGASAGASGRAAGGGSGGR
jgi:hypothetical protein